MILNTTLEYMWYKHSKTQLFMEYMDIWMSFLICFQISDDVDDENNTLPLKVHQPIPDKQKNTGMVIKA